MLIFICLLFHVISSDFSGENVEDAFLDTAKKIYQNIQDGRYVDTGRNGCIPFSINICKRSVSFNSFLLQGFTFNFFLGSPPADCLLPESAGPATLDIYISV